MSSQILADVLKSVMRRHKWSQARLGRELGVSQEWVSKVTRAKLDPGIGKITRLLGRVGFEVHIIPKREDSDPVKRRAFITAAASVTFIPSPTATPYQDSAYVRALAHRLASAYYDHGGSPLITSALRHVQHVKSALGGKDRALQSASSELATWGAWVAHDAGRLDIAERVGRLALALADQGGDHEALGGAYSALTQVSADSNRPDQAVGYARRGLLLPEISDVRRSWANLRLGRVLALTKGQEHAARDVLDQAHSLADPHDGLDATDRAYTAGVALCDLKAYTDAQATFTQALTLAERHSPLLSCQVLARQAAAALQASDPSFAADRMFSLARVAPMLSSSYVDKQVHVVLTLSAGWQRVPEIRNAREQLRAIVSPQGQV